MIRRNGPGCPIRRSQDHCSVTSFPGHIAGSNVLHRLSTPRHPPCALIRLIIPTRPRQSPDEEARLASRHAAPTPLRAMPICSSRSSGRYDLDSLELLLLPRQVRTGGSDTQRDSRHSVHDLSMSDAGSEEPADAATNSHAETSTVGYSTSTACQHDRRPIFHHFDILLPTTTAHIHPHRWRTPSRDPKSGLSRPVSRRHLPVRQPTRPVQPLP